MSELLSHAHSEYSHEALFSREIPAEGGATGFGWDALRRDWLNRRPQLYRSLVDLAEAWSELRSVSALLYALTEEHLLISELKDSNNDTILRGDWVYVEQFFCGGVVPAHANYRVWRDVGMYLHEPLSLKEMAMRCVGSILGAVYAGPRQCRLDLDPLFIDGLAHYTRWKAYGIAALLPPVEQFASAVWHDLQADVDWPLSYRWVHDQYAPEWRSVRRALTVETAHRLVLALIRTLPCRPPGRAMARLVRWVSDHSRFWKRRERGIEKMFGGIMHYFNTGLGVSARLHVRSMNFCYVDYDPMVLPRENIEGSQWWPIEEWDAVEAVDEV